MRNKDLDAELEELSAAEVERRLQKLSGAPDAWQEAGGAGFATALCLAICSFLGVVASLRVNHRGKNPFTRSRGSFSLRCEPAYRLWKMDRHLAK